MMDLNTNATTLALVEKLAEVEYLGESILTKKQMLIDYDRRRHSNREMLGVIRRNEVKEEKVWLCTADCFIKAPIPVVKDLILKEQEFISKEIEEARKEMKTLNAKINSLEGERDIFEGFNLTPLSSAEFI
ncbi:uncharacterized protein LOC135141155 [Zophobas morio]|uniref:uncharacterized protein LOC135141155 n=1 Tax=Zophobas morio TaxID=2755281 RepID=UPI0030836DA8